MAEQLGMLKRCRSAHRMNVKKQLKDAQECIDNNSKDNAELLKLKVGLALKLDKIVKVDEQILVKLCQDDAIECSVYDITLLSCYAACNYPNSPSM